MNSNKTKEKLYFDALEKDIYIWFYKNDNFTYLISKEEISKSEKLSKNRKARFCFSRSCARLALSDLLYMHPLEVPLIANPGETPILKPGWGHISFSHCKDVFLLAWSSEKIGIDIESSERKIKNRESLKNFIFREEKIFLKNFRDFSNSYLLKHWVLREAAIKWDKGTIFSDINNWIIKDNFKKAINKKLNIKVATKFLLYKKFLIGIASNKIYSKEVRLIFKN